MSENKLVEEEQAVVEQGVHNFSSEDKWVKPEDPLLLERLEWFKDQKLGLMMHWGRIPSWVLLNRGR